jgi:hypothetical protein
MISNDFKIGWIVGIIEGEGWIGSDKDGRPKVQVAMTDRDTIYKLLEWAETGIVSESDCGTITGKRIWKWAIYAREDAGKFIEKILPYLGTRRSERAIEVLNKWKLLKPKHGTSTTCKRGHELSGENLYIDVSQEKYPRRRCKKCMAIRVNQYKERWKERLQHASR